MSLVVILDSGLDVSYINTHQIIGGVTFYKYNNVISMRSDSYHDNLGHGTAIYNIISKKCKNSKFFIIKIFDTSFECDPDLFKSALEYIQNNFNSSIIVIPSGAILIDNRVKIKEHIDALYHTGSIIISAFNNQNAISYPAAFESVIGVDTSPSITSEQGYIVIKGSPVDILFKEHSYSNKKRRGY